MRPILIICSIPIFTRNLVWAAGLAGRPCWVMTPQRAGWWRWHPHVLGVTTIEARALTNQNDEFAEFVTAFCRSHHIGAVVGGDTRSTRFLLWAKHRLPPDVACFPMPDSQLFEQLYNKGSFANLLSELGLPQPPTALVRDVRDLENLLFDAPAIVKPAGGEGGCGIEIAATAVQLHDIVAANHDLKNQPVVVQQFIEGKDIDLSVLANHGRCVAWTIQQWNGNGVLDFVQHPEVLALGQELIARTGYHGVIHFDMRIGSRDGKVCFIEANPRFWGSFNYSLWAGINFLKLGIGLARGHRFVEGLFPPPIGPCPYLGLTRRSFARALLGGHPVPERLNDVQRRAWRYHHQILGTTFGYSSTRHTSFALHR